MPDKYEVKCVKKTDRYDPHERIRAIGGWNWLLTQQDAISSIEQGKYAFYVSVQGKPVDVIVSTSRYGNKYLKTVSDGEQPNNLLSLMECVA
jgi:hypothetical protein